MPGSGRPVHGVPSLRVEVELPRRRRLQREEEADDGRAAQAGGHAEGGVARLVGGPGQAGVAAAEARQSEDRLQLILGGGHVQRSVAVSVLRERVKCSVDFKICPICPGVRECRASDTWDSCNLFER